PELQSRPDTRIKEPIRSLLSEPLRSFASRRLAGLAPDAVERPIRAGEELPSRRGEGGPEDLVGTRPQLVAGGQLFRRPRLQHDGAPALVLEIPPPAGRDRRRAELPLQPFLPPLLAGRGLVAGGDAVHVRDDQVIAHHDRRRLVAA